MSPLTAAALDRLRVAVSALVAQTSAADLAAATAIDALTASITPAAVPVAAPESVVGVQP